MYWKYILITGIVGLVGAQAYIKYAAYKTENQKYNEYTHVEINRT